MGVLDIQFGEIMPLQPWFYTTAKALSRNFESACRTSSSYKVQASAELRAFRPTRRPSPSNRLRRPSSLTIRRPATNIFLYLPGMSCNLVLTASKGFVTVVADTAAKTPEMKLIGTDVRLFMLVWEFSLSGSVVVSCNWPKRRFDCS